ncbi:flippase [Patescibacteria group bacterium]|nr:flippase [Patescibacteria group bacterium]
MLFLKGKKNKKVPFKKLKEESIFKEIFVRIKKRDFSGNTGLAIKNSTYQFFTTLIAKGGSFIFTAIIARLLMPELFGYYSLALSTILIFSAVSELGLNQTLIRFVSIEFNKKKNSLKSIILYFGKIKSILILISAFVLLFSANYLANNFFQKPVFLALLAGFLYIFFVQVTEFLKSLLQASNKFLPILKREIFFQIFRMIFVPLAIVLAIGYSLNHQRILMWIIISLGLSMLIPGLFLLFDLRKEYSKKISKRNKIKLPKTQKKTINGFLISTATLFLSGAFFGNIDKIMLGKFVEGEFIGYYSASFSLISALTPFVGISSIVLLPIFSKLKGKSLKVGLKKSLKFTLILSILGFIGTILFSELVIKIVYGGGYLPSINILRILALLLFITPFLSLYQSYYISQAKPQIPAKLLIITTILNLVLNYIFITLLLPHGPIKALYGAGIATILSELFYLSSLMFIQRMILRRDDK